MELDQGVFAPSIPLMQGADIKSASTNEFHQVEPYTTGGKLPKACLSIYYVIFIPSRSDQKMNVTSKICLRNLGNSVELKKGVGMRIFHYPFFC